MAERAGAKWPTSQATVNFIWVMTPLATGLTLWYIYKYNSVEYSLVQYGLVQIGTVWYSTVWYSTVWYKLVQLVYIKGGGGE